MNLPLLGEVPAAGKTPQEFERVLAQQLGAKYLQNPQVTVYVKEYNSRRVTLEGGGIKKPGLYPLRGRLTLLQLIATAEGLSDLSDKSFTLFREVGGKRTTTQIDLDSVRSGETPDPELRSGDLIVAGTSATKEALNNIGKVSPLFSVFRPF